MPVKVIMPKLGLNAQEGLIIEWFKKEGGFVKKGEPLFSLETEKTTMESESPADGELARILVDVNELAPVGSVVALIIEEGENLTTSFLEELENDEKLSRNYKKETNIQINKPTGQSSRVLASPLARKLANSAGIELGDIQKKYGLDLIQVSDIVRFQTENKQKDNSNEAERLSIRRQIATRVMKSLKETAQFTIHSEIDVTSLIKKREYLKQETGQAYSINSYFGMAVVSSLVEYPQFNAVIIDDQNVILDEINIGLAVDTKEGLKVIVVKDLANKTLHELDLSFKKLVHDAKDGNAKLDDLSGSTFTITNLGSFDVGFFTPIINFPEVAILGLGKYRERVCVISEDVSKRWIMDLSLTVDHRFIDGVPAAKFLQAISRNINLV